MFPTGLTILRALVAARWLTWAWTAAIVTFDNDIERPAVAWGLVVVTLGVTVASTVLVRARPAALIGIPFVAVDIGLAYLLSIADGYVFASGHVFATTQSLATQWPLIAVVNAGVAFGPLMAAILGLIMGPAEWLGALANDFSAFGPRETVSLVATSIYFAAIGGVAGWMTQQLHQVESEIADRRARDEVARVLHDTVLQTLALVERQSTDPVLAGAARDADRDLRSFLFAGPRSSGDDLAARVRATVDRARRGHDTAVTINVLDDGCRVDEAGQEAIAWAVGEAVANALEHAAATAVVVYVETDDAGEVYASIHDDGIGFDPETAVGNGIEASIIGRVRAFGGDATIHSAPGHGTEVQIWSRR